jgi:hypothetical protein
MSERYQCARSALEPFSDPGATEHVFPAAEERLGRPTCDFQGFGCSSKRASPGSSWDSRASSGTPAYRGRLRRVFPLLTRAHITAGVRLRVAHGAPSSRRTGYAFRSLRTTPHNWVGSGQMERTDSSVCDGCSHAHPRVDHP